MAADLVHRNVTLIAATTTPANSQAAAKALGLKLNVLHDAYRLAGVYAARILKEEDDVQNVSHN